MSETNCNDTSIYQGEPVHIRGTWFHVFDPPDTDGVVSIQLPDPQATEPEPLRFLTMKDEDGRLNIKNNWTVDQEDIDSDTFKQALNDIGMKGKVGEAAEEMLDDFTQSKLTQHTAGDILVGFLSVMASLFIDQYEPEVPDGSGSSSKDGYREDQKDSIENKGFEPRRAKKAVKRSQRKRNEDRKYEEDREYLLLLLRQARGLQKQLDDPSGHNHLTMLQAGIRDHVYNDLSEHDEVNLDNIHGLVSKLIGEEGASYEEARGFHLVLGQALPEYESEQVKASQKLLKVEEVLEEIKRDKQRGNGAAAQDKSQQALSLLQDVQQADLTEGQQQACQALHERLEEISDQKETVTNS